MSLLRATIIDARRRLRPQPLQALTKLDPYQSSSHGQDNTAVAGTSSASPDVSQAERMPDINRFQKEGNFVPREAPQTSGRDRHGPLADVKRLRENKERVTPTVVEASGVHSPACNDLSVLADSRKSNLATGEGADDEKRQDSMISEMASFNSVQSLEVFSSDASSLDSFQDQDNSASRFESGLQRNSGNVSQSWTPGRGAPSVSSPTGGSKAVWETHHKKASGISYPDVNLHADQAPDAMNSAVGNRHASTAGSLCSSADPSLPEEIKASTYQDIQPELPFASQFRDKPASEPDNHQQLKIHIGQIDVIVIKDSTPKKVQAIANRSENTASRRYWRRL